MDYVTHIKKAEVHDLFRELQERVRVEGVTSYDQYLELIDEVIEEKRGVGALDDDDDMTQIKADLEIMWNTIERE